jgi:ketosteroid isomerase-like protein
LLVADGQAAEGEMVERLRAALESADLGAIRDLLDPDVQWGAPDDATPSCSNREQVLGWYRRGRAAGVRARVTEMAVHGDKLLIGLRVSGNPAAQAEGGEVDRWQVVTIRSGRIVDIRGFDQRAEAAARVATPV